MGLQLEIPPGRTLTIRGTKKVIRNVQRINATTHSYTVHIQMCASEKLSRKLPVVLYEPTDMPQRAIDQSPNYLNLEIYWSKSGLMGSEIAKLWMKDVFLKNVEHNSVLIIDSWTGYKKMLEMPQISAKKLEIYYRLAQPLNYNLLTFTLTVHSNTSSENYFAKFVGKIMSSFWQKRENLLSILDMIWYQCKAPRFESFLKYAWYRAGYTQEHPPEFKTPAQFCLGVKGYMQCEGESCTKFCSLKCGHCERLFCFNDALEPRDDMDF